MRRYFRDGRWLLEPAEQMDGRLDKDAGTNGAGFEGNTAATGARNVGGSAAVTTLNGSDRLFLPWKLPRPVMSP